MYRKWGVSEADKKGVFKKVLSGSFSVVSTVGFLGSTVSVGAFALSGNYFSNLKTLFASIFKESKNCFLMCCCAS